MGHLPASDAATVSPNHAFVCWLLSLLSSYVWTVKREKPNEPCAELGELKPFPLISELISHVAYCKTVVVDATSHFARSDTAQGISALVSSSKFIGGHAHIFGVHKLYFHS